MVASRAPTSRPSSGRSLEEAAAEPAAELVPGVDSRSGLGAQCLGVEPDADGVLVAAIVVDPRFGVVRRHLGVELDRPRRFAETACLQAGSTARERRCPGGEAELVAVPLERLEARRERGE